VGAHISWSLFESENFFRRLFGSFWQELIWGIGAGPGGQRGISSGFPPKKGFFLMSMYIRPHGPAGGPHRDLIEFIIIWGIGGAYLGH
jgi:hypothetical protein